MRQMAAGEGFAKAFCAQKKEGGVSIMRKTKKVLSLTLASAMVLSLAACGGGKTSVLSVKIENVPEADLENGTMFNVVVIYESTPVMYREDGTPYADWNVVLDNGTSQSGSAVQKEGE